jgi:hypothetical protein
VDEIDERRDKERKWCKWEVNWSHFNQGGNFKGHILNFSQEGSYLETAQPIILGTTVLIRVAQCTDFRGEYPKDLRFNTFAEVKWCRELNISEGACYGVGLRYHFPV